MRVAAVLLLASAAACIPEEGPLMSPGEDCLECHRSGNDAPTWTAAGTWLGEGHRVTIRDATGKTLTLRTNQVGNFYTAERLAYPLEVSVDGRTMPFEVPSPLSPPDTCLLDRCCRGERCGCADCHGRGGLDDDDD